MRLTHYSALAERLRGIGLPAEPSAGASTTEPSAAEPSTTAELSPEHVADDSASVSAVNAAASADFIHSAQLAASAVGQLVLGDKGDPEKTADLNNTHAVDLAELGANEATGGDRRGRPL